MTGLVTDGTPEGVAAAIDKLSCDRDLAACPRRGRSTARRVARLEDGRDALARLSPAPGRPRSTTGRTALTGEVIDRVGGLHAVKNAPALDRDAVLAPPRRRALPRDHAVTSRRPCVSPSKQHHSWRRAPAWVRSSARCCRASHVPASTCARSRTRASISTSSRPRCRPVSRSRHAIPARTTRRLWKRFDWPPIEYWTGAIDVVHGPNFVVPPARPRRGARDRARSDAGASSGVLRRNTVQYPQLIRRALQRGAHVHTVSQFVADEVAEVFGVARDASTSCTTASQMSRRATRAGRALVGDRYVLALGTIGPRKNLAALVHAFDEVAATDPDVRLCRARGCPRLECRGLRPHATRRSSADRIVLTGRVDDARRGPAGRGDAVRLPVPVRGFRSAPARGDAGRAQCWPPPSGPSPRSWAALRCSSRRMLPTSPAGWRTPLGRTSPRHPRSRAAANGSPATPGTVCRRSRRGVRGDQRRPLSAPPAADARVQESTRCTSPSANVASTGSATKPTDCSGFSTENEYCCSRSRTPCPRRSSGARG